MAFTMGTEQEVGFLWDALDLRAGRRVLDVGCGPGRHALTLARRGCEVVGVDLSPEFVALARGSAVAEGLPASFEVLDVRELAYDAEFDAAVCLCQGGFGLLGGHDDEAVVARIAHAVRPGGGVAITAFSSYFALRFLEEGEAFDAATGVVHEVSTLRAEDGEERSFDAWTTCFTARELTLLAEGAGLHVDAVHSVAPGQYDSRPPSLDHPELLLLGRREVHLDTG
jgi:SAM-dependent methyltransferase